MVPRARSLALLTSFVACLACTPSGEKPDAPDDKPADGKANPQPTIETVEHVDVGTVCVSGTADQPHEIKVDFGLCLSSSCDQLVEASCTVEQSGVDLKVTGKATIRSEGGPNTVCTTDCGMVSATCSGPTLAAGTYALSYAGKSIEFTVPVAGEPACTSR